ncbi:MAG: AAA family ATPase [Deltaproteobacteria bacterium]|nr:AAA family ATPase [Deltaproteobacteria bacterium]MBW2414495.1 AAA family ATPase [Deltaproteobacteria bacterium]
MYQDFFGLREKPFALLPDPRFLYLSRCHREALAHLMYGIEQGEGFIEVVGQVGTGKTTLCRTLLERIGGSAETAYIFNPSRTETELLAAINREFGLPTAARSRSELIDELNRFLLAKKGAGRTVLLIIDEAQNLEVEVLEQIRLLSNLETDREKLLQIVLVGQPELEDNLARADLRQLNQRISVRWGLRPFPVEETAEYVNHRLRIAGMSAPGPFTPRALRRLHRLSGGVPRVINAIADRALLAAFAASEHRVTPRMINTAARELPRRDFDVSSFGVGTRAATSLVATGLVVGFLATAWWPLRADSSRWGLRTAPAQDLRSAQGLVSAEGVEAIPAVAPERVRLSFQAPEDLVEADAHVTAAAALGAVLSAWGYPAPTEDQLDPNFFASAVREVSSLRVFATRSSLAELEGLDLPVILELEPLPDERRYVALLGLRNGAALLALRELEIDLDAASVERIWTGRSFFLWENFERLPALGPRMTGSAVRWLQARLTDLGYMRRGDASGEFDERTEGAVQIFQREHGLEGDGEVGPATLIALYQALDYGAPRLGSGEVS